ncbi:MAG: hypothetical protein KIT87_00540 [Anaerolineae bacterium]|nr:hypothetical protein [Anaerolineae bacterium]
MDKGSSRSSLGFLMNLPRQAVLFIAVILVVCIALGIWGARTLQQRFTGNTTPAALLPATASGPIKVDGEAVIVASRLTPLRQEPGDRGAVILLVAEGQTLKVAEGPRPLDNRNWWRVTVGSHTGWLPETLSDGTRLIAAK